MQVIGLIGYTDKYDLIINLAKALNIMEKSVLVVDGTLDRKLKYIVPKIENTEKSYLTKYDEVDFAVGFDSISDVESYMSNHGIDISKYDFVLVDIDSPRGYEVFRTKNIDKNYFFIETSVLSISKNMDIIKAIKECETPDKKTELKKVLYRAYTSRAANDYFESKIKEYEVEFKGDEFEIPLQEQDKMADIDSQFSGIISFKKHTKYYITTLCDLVADIMGEINAKDVMMQIKRRKI